MIYTVFFKDRKESPQDFETYKQAKEYAEEYIKALDNIEYDIVSTEGEII